MKKLACFDLDDTLIREIHSVMLLCILNDKLSELHSIEESEYAGKLNWIDADYLKARLLKGLKVNTIADGVKSIANPINGIIEVISKLHQNGIKCLLLTSGPSEVARVVKEQYGFDAYGGSEYEIVNGEFTGEITHHLADTGKAQFLRNFCKKEAIALDDCIAIGDGSTDIPLFKICGTSIAINASSAKVADNATYSIRTENLEDILILILG